MNHPTIRTMAGASAPQAIAANSTALLVIDFQNEYFSGRMPIPDGMAALRNTQRLVAHADRAGMPVFHIQHVTPAGSPIFAEDGDTVPFHSGLQPAPHHAVVQKSQVSAFQGTDLDQRLKAAGIKTLIVSGLMTHMCVTGAARDAVPLGYAVIVPHDACATRDLDGPAGLVPHAELHRAALAAIADAFGDVLSTSQVLELKLEPEAS
jgi:nicotinamidase-related amidase